MIAVIFEVEPADREAHLGIAGELKPLLDGIDGFISVERFHSLSDRTGGIRIETQPQHRRRAGGKCEIRKGRRSALPTRRKTMTSRTPSRSGLGSMLLGLYTRSVTLKQLADLDDRQLADIGLTRLDVQRGRLVR